MDCLYLSGVIGLWGGVGWGVSTGACESISCQWSSVGRVCGGSDAGQIRKEWTGQMPLLRPRAAEGTHRTTDTAETQTAWRLLPETQYCGSSQKGCVTAHKQNQK